MEKRNIDWYLHNSKLRRREEKDQGTLAINKFLIDAVSLFILKISKCMDCVAM